MDYARCINNRGYEASLTVGAVYKILPDDSDPTSLRVIDNEGEDYLYAAHRFQLIKLDDLPHKPAETITIHLGPS